ncbi:MAG: hypothetical protein AAGC44_01490 [Planctomycetota bacterium]
MFDPFAWMYRTPRVALISLIVLASIGYFGVYGFGELTERGAQSHNKHFAYLAQSMLQGRLDVDQELTEQMHEIVLFEGKYYIVYPPMTAIVSLPFVAVFGPEFRTGLLSISFAIGAIALMFVWLRRLKCSVEVSWWGTILFAFGMGFWYSAIKGSSWQFGHVVGVFFMTWSLVEATGKGRGWLAGLLLGMALWARLPMVLATPFIAYFVWNNLRQPADQDSTDDPSQANTRSAWLHAALVFAGVGVFVGLNALYNFARFGTHSNIAYRLIPGVLDEPWYDKGIIHLSYLPRNIHVALFQPPINIHEFPYFVPAWFGMSMLICTPAYFLIAKVHWARRLPWVLVLATLVCMGPGLLHGWPGGGQLGYRFSFDAAPMLIALVALGMSQRFGWRDRGLVILSGLIGIWGLMYIQQVPVQWLYWPPAP